jgi:hypothetical protein
MKMKGQINGMKLDEASAQELWEWLFNARLVSEFERSALRMFLTEQMVWAKTHLRGKGVYQAAIGRVLDQLPECPVAVHVICKSSDRVAQEGVAQDRLNRARADKNVLDYEIYSGKRLGNCTLADLQQSTGIRDLDATSC